MSKRKREEEATEATEKEAKALKREMRQRGHVVRLLCLAGLMRASQLAA